LIIVPANLRKQWHQELQDKFSLQGLILEAKNYNVIRKQEGGNPFLIHTGPVICSYQFAKSKEHDLKTIAWDLVVLDEAHRLRNVYKPRNVIGRTLKDALARVHSKVLLTATPLQNSLLELYGLVSIIDDRVFGDLDSFRAQFSNQNRESAFDSLRTRLAPVCKRTLRRQVQPYVSFTARRAIVKEFTPSNEEKELSGLVADYLRRPNLKALPEGQRQLISLVLWKLLASSTHAVAGALETMANRLQGVLDADPDVLDLTETLDEDYESLAETADEWDERPLPQPLSHRERGWGEGERTAIAQEVEELRHFKALGNEEQHLIVSACTVDGEALAEDDPEKLYRFPAALSPSPLAGEGWGEGDAPPFLTDLELRQQTILREINQRNLGYFQQEVEKLDSWADDLKLGLEQDIKAIDNEI
jgi:hypothetical protein